MPKGKPYAYDGATKKKQAKIKPTKKSPAPKMPMMKKGSMRGY